MMNQQEKLIEIFNAALDAVDPYKAVRRAVTIQGSFLHANDAVYDLDRFERIIVVGAGKASARMALAIEGLLRDRITAGIVVVKDGYTEKLAVIAQEEASHPVPDMRGENAARRILEMLRAADDKTLVICLLSGGASALMVAPAGNLALIDKQRVTELLLRSGASISEVNAVRKHLSAIKGGRLAKAAFPAEVLTLVVSDVIGNPLDAIASGPTAADSTSFSDAMAVVKKYGLQSRMPPGVMRYLQSGVTGEVPETIKAGDSCLMKTHNVIVASNHQALVAAREKAIALGYEVAILSETLQGEARDAARFLAQACASKGHKRCILSGGETTVTVHGSGKGGRNQELALAFALEVEGEDDIFLLSAGTDGSDGPTDAAGALVCGSTAAMARALGIDPSRYLDDNDAYTFFHQLDLLSGEHSHVITGPTGTNVMDIQIMLIGSGAPL